ncbi:MAG: hypothetical protein ACLF0G_11660 [Candidatus Brocadiia bacterium]
MRVRCPHCNASLTVADDFPQPRIRCGGCGGVVDLPVARCPGCGAPLARGGAPCVRCGSEVGRSPGAEPPEEDEEREGLALRVLLFVGELVPGLFRPGLVVLSLVLVVVGLGVLGFAAFLFSLGLLFSPMAVGAVGLLAYAQGVAVLLNGQACLLSEALAELVGPQWLLFLALIAAPFVVMLLLLQSGMGG